MISNNDGLDNQPPMFGNPDLPLAVVVASTRWDEPPRMRHHLTRQLMRRFNVLFVEFFPTGTPDRDKERWRWASEKLLVYSPLPPVRIPSRLYANEPLSHKVVNLYFNKQIRNAVRCLPCDQSLLFNFVYHYPEIMAVDLFAYKAYICYDEFPRMQRRAHQHNPIKAWYQANLFQHYENRVAGRANCCFTPHYPLRDKLKKVNDNVEMLFHAHDSRLMPPCEAVRKSGTIRVAYAGHINWRLLPDWLVEVSNQRDMSLYMIGPLEGSHPGSDLLKQPTINHLPSLSEERLMQKLAEMDVLVMPYDPAIPEVSILTTNSKIFQYVSTCKPIVISNLPHYIDLPYGVIYKAKDRQDFVTQIRKAFHENNESYVRLRQQIALENTWDQRGDALFDLLKQDLPALGFSEPPPDGDRTRS